MSHRRFVLDRLTDETGVSGTGIVAEGALFSNGVAVLQWTSEFPTSVVFHQRGMESIDAVHGHGGKTRVRFLDAPVPDDLAEPLTVEDAEELLRRLVMDTTDQCSDRETCPCSVATSWRYLRARGVPV